MLISPFWSLSMLDVMRTIHSLWLHPPFSRQSRLLLLVSCQILLFSPPLMFVRTRYCLQIHSHNHKDYARCAVLAKEGGYDGVEIMGSEGYLINEVVQ